MKDPSKTIPITKYYQSNNNDDHTGGRIEYPLSQVKCIKIKAKILEIINE